MALTEPQMYQVGKGKVVLLNYQIFKGKSSDTENKEKGDERIKDGRYRHGSGYDTSLVTQMANKLDCDLEVKLDLTKLQTTTFIKEDLRKQEGTHSYLMLVLSSHGDHDDIIMSTDDQEMSLYDDIMKPLNNNACPKYAGVPKIFIVNACRGEGTLQLTKGVLKDGGHLYTDQTEIKTYTDSEAIFSLGEPTIAKDLHRPIGDVYIIFSTTPDSVSMRYGDTGSPLLMTLWKTLCDFDCSNQIGFLEWVDKIGRKMADNYEIQIETRDILDSTKKKSFVLSPKQLAPGTYTKQFLNGN